MNIGMILDNEFTGDLRVENEVTSLQQAGFNVFVLCFNYGNKPQFEDYNGAKIIRISVSKNKIKKLRALTNTLFNFYPRFWSNHILKFIDKNQIDVLHVHDLYMFSSAFLANKKLNNKLKIVGDLHENYVEGLKHYRFSTTFPGNILISIRKWEKTEIEWINKLDYAITVIEEAVERYKLIGADVSKFTVVPNYVNMNEFGKFVLDESITQKYKNNFVITYIGGFDSHRGIETVINSLPLLIKDNRKIKLVLVGTGQIEDRLKMLASNLGVSEMISFEGWQKPETLRSYIHASDVCLIPHLKTVHTDNTIPHKLFQYMYFERPVVASNCKPIERIVNETAAGLIYESGNHSSLAEKLKSLIDNPEVCKQMGSNGKRAVAEKYNWENASKNLVNLYFMISKKTTQ